MPRNRTSVMPLHRIGKYSNNSIDVTRRPLPLREIAAKKIDGLTKLLQSIMEFASGDHVAVPAEIGAVYHYRRMARGDLEMIGDLRRRSTAG